MNTSSGLLGCQYLIPNSQLNVLLLVEHRCDIDTELFLNDLTGAFRKVVIVEDLEEIFESKHFYVALARIISECL